jgi:hypothetical protein
MFDDYWTRTVWDQRGKGRFRAIETQLCAKFRQFDGADFADINRDGHVVYSRRYAQSRRAAKMADGGCVLPTAIGDALSRVQLPKRFC